MYLLPQLARCVALNGEAGNFLQLLTKVTAREYFPERTAYATSYLLPAASASIGALIAPLTFQFLLAKFWGWGNGIHCCVVPLVSSLGFWVFILTAK